jgi:hypothetical protein
MMILWFDNSSNPFEAKLQVAASHFQNRFGRSARTCHVNPAENITGSIGGISIEQDPLVLKSHLWIGDEA